MRPMSAGISEALADLLEISSQIDAAVVLGDEGAAAAAGLAPERADAFARAARHLLSAAGAERESEVAHVEVDLPEGAVFVLREGEAAIAAVTTASPTSALVLYDLRTCLRRAAEASQPEEQPRKPENADAAA